MWETADGWAAGDPRPARPLPPSLWSALLLSCQPGSISGVSCPSLGLRMVLEPYVGPGGGGGVGRDNALWSAGRLSSGQVCSMSPSGPAAPCLSTMSGSWWLPRLPASHLPLSTSHHLPEGWGVAGVPFPSPQMKEGSSGVSLQFCLALLLFYLN